MEKPIVPVKSTPAQELIRQAVTRAVLDNMPQGEIEDALVEGIAYMLQSRDHRSDNLAILRKMNAELVRVINGERDIDWIIKAE